MKTFNAPGIFTPTQNFDFFMFSGGIKKSSGLKWVRNIFVWIIF